MLLSKSFDYSFNMNIFLKGLRFLLRRTGQLSQVYRMINGAYPTFEVLNPDTLKAVTLALQEAPQGDYYEFGLYKGFTFWFATQIAQALKKNKMRFYGFDSFEGLPEPKGIDKEPTVTGDRFAKGCISASEELVRELLKKHGADMNKISLFKGFFKDSLRPSLLSEQSLGPAAVILVDCDFYESTRDVLKFIPPLIQEGTIIIFDDWFITGKNAGQQLAVREWLERMPGVKFEDFCSFNFPKGFKIRK